MYSEKSTGDGQNNGNTRQHRNKTVCDGCTERTSLVSIFCYSFVCLCCVVPVSMLYKLWAVTVRMTVLQNGRFVRFSKSWSICNQTATLLGITRVAVSKVMTAYTNHGKT